MKVHKEDVVLQTIVDSVNILFASQATLINTIRYKPDFTQIVKVR